MTSMTEKMESARRTIHDRAGRADGIQTVWVVGSMLGAVRRGLREK